MGPARAVITAEEAIRSITKRMLGNSVESLSKIFRDMGSAEWFERPNIVKGVVMKLLAVEFFGICRRARMVCSLGMEDMPYL
jgi:hypothetical protein